MTVIFSINFPKILGFLIWKISYEILRHSLFLSLGDSRWSLLPGIQRIEALGEFLE